MADPFREHEELLSRRVALASMMAAALVGIGCNKRVPKPPSPTADLGKGFRPIERRLRKAVSDKHRRQAVHGILDEIQSEMNGMNGIVGDWRRELALLGDHQWRHRDVILEITTKHNRRVLEKLSAAAQHAMNLRRYITADEWPKVFPPHKGGAA